MASESAPADSSLPVTATESNIAASSSVAEPASDTTTAVPEAGASAKTEEKVTTEGKLEPPTSELPENLADGHRTQREWLS